jgi:hypothetical protein
MPTLPSLWRIERNRKEQFCVVRDTEDGRDYVTSANGKPSSFKTFDGARRALRRAVEDTCTLCGAPHSEHSAQCVVE